ncbi:MAG: hypothetical protein ABI822_17195 [Bryobacteraceae bacterium]
MIKRVAIFLVSAALTSVFIINFCALIYQCGCHSFWAGAADECNIHSFESHHCPWCSIGTEGFVAVVAGIVAVQAALTFGPFRMSPIRRLLSSLIAFPVAGSVIAVALGLWQGYWK